MICFFHLVKGEERVLDADGVEVVNVDQAILQVGELVSEVAADGPEELQAWRGWFFEVTDVSGAVLFTTALASDES